MDDETETPEDVLDALVDRWRDEGGDTDDFLALLGEVADEVEWLATIDDEGGGFTSSGSAGLYVVHLGGKVSSFHTFLDADPFELRHEHDEGDAAGRDRMLRRLIDEWLVGVGVADVTLGDVFTPALRQAVRQAGEENGGAPWDTGLLAEDLADADDEDLARLAREHAPALRATEAEVLAALDRLRDAPDDDPATDLDRRVAWRVSWPALDLEG